MPKLKINHLSDYFFYVLLLSFVTLPFYAAYKTATTKPTEVFISESEGVGFRIVSTKNTYAPNEEAIFYVEGVSGTGSDTLVNNVVFSVFVPKTLSFPTTDDQGVKTELTTSLVVDYKSVEPFRTSEYNQIVVLLSKKPGLTFPISANGTKLISFKVSSANPGAYSLKFRDVEPTFGAYDATDPNPINLFNGVATGQDFNIAPTTTPGITPTIGVTPTISITPTIGVTPTPVITPTVGITPTVAITPTPRITPTVVVTPTPVVPSPTVSPSSIKGISLSIALMGRDKANSVRGNYNPSVFVGVWRESTKTMLASSVVSSNNLGVVSGLSALLSGNGTSFNLNASDIVVVKPESYLSKTFTVGSLSQSGTNIVVPATTYTAGDVAVQTGSFDIINIVDASFSWSYYGSGQVKYPYFLDYNGDGIVTIIDFSYFSTYVGQKGQSSDNDELQRAIENVIRSKLFKVIEVTN